MTLQTFTADEIGTALGSAIGSLLVGGNSLASIPVNTVLSTALGDFVTVIKNLPDANVTGLLTGALNNLPQALEGQGAGAIAGFLTAELVQAIGLKGIAAQVLSTATNVTVGRIVSNLIANPSTPFAGITSSAALGPAVGAFIGTEIGEALLPAATQAEAIGGDLGSVVTVALASELLAASASGTTGVAVGAAAAGGTSTVAGDALASAASDVFGAYAGTVLNFAIPVVGALVGYVVGNLLGDLIGGTPSPQAWAGIGVAATGADGATFTLQNFSSKDDGPVALVQELASSTIGALNAVLTDIGGQVLSPGAVTGFTIGVRRGIASYFTGTDPNNLQFPDPGQLVTYAVANALSQILQRGGIAGGDVYIKRAVQAYLTEALPDPGSGQVSGDLTALTGDIAIAQDYEAYVNNTAAINALIASSPDSDFAAGWLATLAGADALGLDRRQSSDWGGGWGGYLATLSADPEQLSVSFAGNARWITVGATTYADTIASNAKDVITDSTANDTISIDQAGTLDGGNVFFNGTAAAVGQSSYIAAVIYAAPGNSVVYAGGQGDDVVGNTGTAAGNELLVAGWINGGIVTSSQNATWLFAGAGQDTLVGGASGGDMVQGGTGNDLMLEGDVLYAPVTGGNYATLFVGGSGDDTMEGLTGNDIFQVGAGAPTTLIEAGAGDDTIVFGFGDGDVTVTDASGEDELSLGPGITWSNLSFAQNGSDLDITLENANRQPTGDEITLSGWFTNRAIQWLRFDDGSQFQLGTFHFVFGGPNANTLLAYPGAPNWIITAPGFGSINGWMGNGIFNAGIGDDSIVGGDGEDTVEGADTISGDDTLIGNAGDDTLVGGFKTGPGTDFIVAGSGDDVLIAGANGDTMVAAPGADTFIGGGGNDLIEYSRGDGQDVILNPLTLSTATVAWQDGNWVNGYGWQHYATGAADGGGYDAVTNGTNTIIDTRGLDETGTGVSGYLEYDTSTTTLYWWSTATALAEGKGCGDSTLQFGSGVTANDLLFQRSGNDLVIGIRANGDLTTPLSQLTDAVTLADYFVTGSAVQTLSFASGGTLDLNAIGIVVANGDTSQTVEQAGAASADGTLIYGGAGNDTLIGGAGADTIVGGGGNNLIEAGSGSDLLEAGNGTDTFLAGPGNDTFVGGTGSNTVSFADELGSLVAILDPSNSDGLAEQGAATGDVFTNIGTIIGNAASDTLVGGNGGVDFDPGASAGVRNDLIGGTGDNIYQVHATGSVTISNAAGGDSTILLDSGEALTDLYFGVANQNAPGDGLALNINYQPGGPTAAVSANYLIDNYFQNDGTGVGTGVIQELETGDGRVAPLGDIVLTGTATGSADVLLVGNVEINGTSAPQTVLSAAGSSGNDLLIGTSGNDTLIGGSGDDTFEGGGGANLIQGSTLGTNTVSYADAPAAVNVDLATGIATNGTHGQDTLSNIEGVIGSGFNDTITGGAGNYIVAAGNGNALIDGGTGADTLIGGTGADTIYGGTGAGSLIEADASNGETDNATHVLVGQGAADTIYGGSSVGDQIYANGQNELVYGGTGFDTITVSSGNDTIFAGPGGAIIHAGSGNDLIEGNGGIDDFYAGNGNDTLESGGGSNLLYAGSGTDTLINSAGDATMYGGSGRDTFVVDADSGDTLIVAPTGVHDLVLQNPTASQPLSINDIWLAQEGNNLVISVIGSTAQVTIQDFFLSASPTGPGFSTVRRIIVGDQELFLSDALHPINEALPNVVQLMGTNAAQDQMPLDSRGVPTSMPIQVTDLQSLFWFPISGTAADSLTAADANQTVVGGNGNNLITSAIGTVTTDGTYTMSGHDELIAGSGNDTIQGVGGNNTLVGGAGNDVFESQDGSNIVFGGSGNDTVLGDGSLDLESVGDLVEAGTGSMLVEGGTGSNLLIGGSGSDTLEGDGYGTSPGNDGLDELIAGSGDQTMIGGYGSNYFMTGNGADSIVGNGLVNTIYIDSAGSDTIVGSPLSNARNTVNFSMDQGPIDVSLQSGGQNDGPGDYNAAWSTGEVFQNVNEVVGSTGGGIIDDVNDTRKASLVAVAGNTLLDAAGSSGQDTLQAGTGSDTLIGGDGNDLLVGGSGNDSIIAGSGNDTLIAGTGDTYLQSGTGPDIYILGEDFGNDTINNADEPATGINSLGLVGANDQGIPYNQLWFQQSGDNLVMSVIGGTGEVTFWDWFDQPATQRQQTQITYFINTLSYQTENVNISGLVTLMSNYQEPTIASLGSLLDNPTYIDQLLTLWQADLPPTIALDGTVVSAGTEDQELTLTFNISHYIPNVGQELSGITASAISGDATLIADDGINFGTISPDGNVTVTISPQPYQYGSADVTFAVVDQNGLTGSVVVPITFDQINIAPNLGPIIGSESVPGENMAGTLYFDATDPNVLSSNLSATIAVTDLTGDPVTWLSGTLIKSDMSQTATAANWQLVLTPEHDHYGTVDVTIAVSNIAVNGLATMSTTETFQYYVAPTDMPEISELPYSKTIGEHSSESIGFSVLDENPTETITAITATSSANWLLPTISGTSLGDPTLTLTATGYQAGIGTIDVRATDNAGSISDFPIVVTVTPTDYPASLSNATLSVADETPGSVIIGTIDISDLNFGNAVAASDGFTTLSFAVTGETYYKDGVQVSDSGSPIYVVQDPNNRSIADIYPNEAYNWLNYDSIVTTLQGTDGAGNPTSNVSTIDISIPDPHIWTPTVIAQEQTWSASDSQFVYSSQYYSVDVSTVDTAVTMSYTIYSGSLTGPAVGSGTLGNGGTFAVLPPGFSLPFSLNPTAWADNSVLYYVVSDGTHTVNSGPLDVYYHVGTGSSNNDGPDPYLPDYTSAQESSIWLQTTGSLVSIYTDGTAAASFDPTNAASEISLADGAILTEPSLNKLVAVMDLYTAATGIEVPTPTQLAQSATGEEVLEAISAYWNPPPAASDPNESVLINQDSSITTIGSAAGTDFLLTFPAAVNWPPVAPPGDLPNLPTGESSISVDSGGYQGDVITVDPTVTAPVFINGGTEFPQLIAGQGDDVLVSAATGAVLTAGSGDDVLYATGNDATLIGGAGLDTLASGTTAADVTFLAGSGADTITGSDLNATVSFSSASSGVYVDLSTGAVSGGAAGDVITGVNNVIGSAFNDTLAGGAGPAYLKGEAGDDVLIGDFGSDTLDGTGGDTTADYADFANSSGTVTIDLATGQATDGTGGTDTLTDISNAVAPTTGSALLIGNTGSNVLTGGAGDDTFEAVGGDDTFVGGSGISTYLFGSGSGEVTIEPAVEGGSGTLAIEPGTSLSSLWFAQSGTNLVVSTIGASDTVIAMDWGAQNLNPISELQLWEPSSSTSQLVGPAGLAALAQAETDYQATVPAFVPQAGTVDIIEATADSTQSAGGAQGAILIGGDDSILNGGSAQCWLVDIGTNSTINGGSGPAYIALGGSADSATGQSDTTLFVVGNYDTVVAGIGSSGSVSGVGNTVNLLPGSTLTDTGVNNFLIAQSTADQAATVIAIGNDATIQIGVDGSLIANGISNTAYTGANLNAQLNGISNAVWGSDNMVAIEGGSNNVLSGGDNSSVMVIGTADGGGIANAGTMTISGTADTLSIGNNGSLALIGTRDTVYAGVTLQAVVTGTSNYLWASGYVTANVSGSGDFLGAGDNSSASVTGTDDGGGLGAASTLTMGGSLDVMSIGDHGTIIMDGVADTLFASGTSSAATISGSYNTLWGAAHLLATAGGSSNLVSAGDSSTITVTGTNDIIVGGTAADTTLTGTALNTDLEGSLVVTGATGTFSDSGDALIGNSGPATVAVIDNGTIAASQLDIGDLSWGSGTVSVTGTGSSLSVSGQLTIGGAGDGSLSVLSGATVTAENVCLGLQSGSSGNVLIDGAGSEMEVANDLYIGDAGSGTFTVGPSAFASAETLTVGSNSVLNVGGTVYVYGALINYGTIDPQQLVIAPGALMAGSGEETYSESVVNSGTILATGDLDINTPLLTAGAAQAGTVEIANGAQIEIVGGSVDATQAIMFGGQSGTLDLSDPVTFHGVIDDFGGDDAIMVSGISVAAESFNPDDGVLSLLGGDGATVAQLMFGSVSNGSSTMTFLHQGDGPGGLSSGVLASSSVALDAQTLDIGATVPGFALSGLSPATEAINDQVGSPGGISSANPNPAWQILSDGHGGSLIRLG